MPTCASFMPIGSVALNNAMDETRAAPIEVVAGVIRDDDGRVLVSQRRPGTHLEHLWEFPGGKLEPGETHVEALRRELEEEVGLETLRCQPLLSVTHAYPEKTIRLWLFEVSQFNGEAEGREHQRLRWVELEDLSALDMPAADRPLVRVLPLGGQYAISLDPGDFDHVHDFLWRWQACLESGVRLIRLRAQEDSIGLINRWLPELQSITRQFNARWLVSGKLEDCIECPADGIHLDRHQLAMLSRRPVGADRLLAASCHDLKELRRAEALKADFITLSPVQATASHPGAAVLGWDGMAELVAQSALPVYGLGGLNPKDLPRARALGAFGVSGIRSFGWSLSDD